MLSCALPQRNLSDLEKRSFEQILVSGNSLLRKIRDEILKKNSWSKQQCSLTKLRLDIFRLDKPDFIHGVYIDQEFLNSMNKIRDIEYTIMCGHSNLIYKLANKFSMLQCGLTAEDFYNEGVIAVQRAIYAYSKIKNKFSTYVHWVIRRQMIFAVNKFKPLSGLSAKATQLLIALEKTKRKSNAPINLETASNQMELTVSQRHILNAAMSVVIYESQIPKNENSYWDAEEKKPAKISFDELFQKLSLSEFEEDVLKTFINNSGKRGWKTEVAERWNYSRMAPVQAMKRIRQRASELESCFKDAA